MVKKMHFWVKYVIFWENTTYNKNLCLQHFVKNDKIHFCSKNQFNASKNGWTGLFFQVKNDILRKIQLKSRNTIFFNMQIRDIFLK